MQYKIYLVGHPHKPLTIIISGFDISVTPYLGQPDLITDGL